jgi:integration host factor subunit beta
MIKSELIGRIASQSPHLYQRDIENIVNAIIDEIVKALGRGHRVELRDFGVFSPKRRGARTGRNPKTGAEVQVAQKVINRETARCVDWEKGSQSLQCSKKRTRFSAPRDIQRAIAFYTQRLGFKLAFGDKADPPNYVGFRRDAVELHMQFQFEHEMGTIRLRFLVDDPDALFSEYRQRGVECNPNSVHDTSWGTREFALYDLDRNALTFYRHLTSAEKERQMVESS